MKELTGEQVKVTASYSRKVQLVQYADSVDIGCYYSALADDEKEAPQVYARLFEQCKQEVDSRIEAERRIIDGRQEKLEKQLTTNEEVGDLIGD